MVYVYATENKNENDVLPGLRLKIMQITAPSHEIPELRCSRQVAKLPSCQVAPALTIFTFRLFVFAAI